MLLTKKFISIHNGKTGGSSCSRFLIHNVKDKFWNVTESSNYEMEGIPESRGISIPGGRHSNIEEAIPIYEKLTAKNFDNVEKIFVVIRHPITLEWSLYNHLRRPEVIARRKDIAVIAARNDFNYFLEHGLHHRPAHPQEKYFLVNGKIHHKVHLIRYEGLEVNFVKALKPYLNHEITPFPVLNRNPNKVTVQPTISSEILDKIYIKHKYMFDEGYYSMTDVLS